MSGTAGQSDLDAQFLLQFLEAVEPVPLSNVTLFICNRPDLTSLISALFTSADCLAGNFRMRVRRIALHQRQQAVPLYELPAPKKPAKADAANTPEVDRKLPAHLPGESKVYRPETAADHHDATVQTCGCTSCGGRLRLISQDVSEQLEYVPAHSKATAHLWRCARGGPAASGWRRGIRGISSSVVQTGQGLTRRSNAVFRFSSAKTVVLNK
jgi:hypothetical protein